MAGGQCGIPWWPEGEALSQGARDSMACHDEGWSGRSRCIRAGVGLPARVSGASESEWLVEAK